MKTGKIILAAAAFIIVAAFLAKDYVSETAQAKEPANTVKPDDKDDMSGWSKASKTAAMMIKKKYGEPDEKSDVMMMWKDTGPWKRTIVYAKEYEHDFPIPHSDVVQQWIDYQVPEDKFDELARFDGSVVCNRTNGELSARCNKEEANMLAINLAYDIIKGNKDVQAARDFYAKQVKDMINGGDPRYTRKLIFTPPSGNTADTDKPSSIISDSDIEKAKQMREKMEREMEQAAGTDGWMK